MKTPAAAFGHQNQRRRVRWRAVTDDDDDGVPPAASSSLVSVCLKHLILQQRFSRFWSLQNLLQNWVQLAAVGGASLRRNK